MAGAKMQKRFIARWKIIIKELTPINMKIYLQLY